MHSDCFACKDAKQALTKYTNMKSEHSLCEADKGDVMKKWFMAQNYGGNGSMELPFSLGEVTGNYLDVTDKMLAASATLLYNMGHREKQDCRTLLKLVYQVLLKRVNYWNSLLRVQHSDIQVFHISEHVLMLIKEASSQLGYKQMDDVDNGVNCWEAFMLVWSVLRGRARYTYHLRQGDFSQEREEGGVWKKLDVDVMYRNNGELRIKTCLRIKEELVQAMGIAEEDGAIKCSSCSTSVLLKEAHLICDIVKWISAAVIRRGDFVMGQQHFMIETMSHEKRMNQPFILLPCFPMDLFVSCGEEQCKQAFFTLARKSIELKEECCSPGRY